jgi:hypothetical protein
LFEPAKECETCFTQFSSLSPSLSSESDDVSASVIVVETSFGEVSQLVKNIL